MFIISFDDNDRKDMLGLGSAKQFICRKLKALICNHISVNCNGHYNVGEGDKCAKATTVTDIEQGVKDMKIYLDLDYERGSQAELEKVQKCPNADFYEV